MKNISKKRAKVKKYKTYQNYQKGFTLFRFFEFVKEIVNKESIKITFVWILSGANEKEEKERETSVWTHGYGFTDA